MNKLIILIIAALIALSYAQNCSEAMQIACIDDFRAAYPVC
jgi:hypothetical protein